VTEPRRAGTADRRRSSRGEGLLRSSDPAGGWRQVQNRPRRGGRPRHAGAAGDLSHDCWGVRRGPPRFCPRGAGPLRGRRRDARERATSTASRSDVRRGENCELRVRGTSSSGGARQGCRPGRRLYPGRCRTGEVRGARVRGPGLSPRRPSARDRGAGALRDQDPRRACEQMKPQRVFSSQQHSFPVCCGRKR
jgi:hypothetical protein